MKFATGIVPITTNSEPLVAEVPPFALFAAIYRRHGHRCPMSTLGGRLGFAARRHFAAGPSRLAAVYRIATCAVDGIRQAIGCEAALEVREEGEHRLTLADLDSHTWVELELRAEALAMAGEYRRQMETFEEARAGLAPAEVLAWQGRTEALLDRLLGQLRTLPDAELLIIRTGSAHE
jgi:formylmethanofuran dehydrogenase subunit E